MENSQTTSVSNITENFVKVFNTNAEYVKNIIYNLLLKFQKHIFLIREKKMAYRL